MAIYEYLCPTCKSEFELVRPMSESGKAGTCPECGSEGQKLMSGFGSKTGSYIQAPGKPFRWQPGKTETGREQK
jgi:putative FmdB family regulatory protein